MGRKFLKDVGFSNVYVLLGDSNPVKIWIQSQIQKGYNDILFLDDSPMNESAKTKTKISKYQNG